MPQTTKKIPTLTKKHDTLDNNEDKQQCQSSNNEYSSKGMERGKSYMTSLSKGFEKLQHFEEIFQNSLCNCMEIQQSHRLNCNLIHRSHIYGYTD